MSFRDDHDAAISRIAALEHELEEARAEAREQSERERGRIAMLEREIADLRRGEPPPPRRARPPSTPPVVKAAPAQPIDELATRGPAVSGFALVGLLMLVGAIIGAIMWFGLLRETEVTPAEPTRCEIQSLPLHADVIGVHRGEELRLGIAPIERHFDQWRDYSRIILRLPGYEDRIVEPPSSKFTCPLGPIELMRR